ncbi:hypothetical protein AVEN_157315-1 [Araneus ventricosus]|uniref:Uncharacterized protein n=1 Tax=Araneus ventricosus TaxID=182803 RepID=A0A4Y2RG69_ARAVE|nr:hypothetical protein AVEN_195745-1 [Araneus ventricosus]GBN74641.1 hypothetical protein AVEN_257821-1 [Araneus ventricosus]GBN74646.1 hypothetical protein AVEN_31931-1 [Araneus ventricosus]GBN74681.1 hypothetical protein AVEN_157315-1 [Araneus ventricosus]
MRQSSLNGFGVRRISLESCSHCELVSCLMLSAIVRAITVIVHDLLSSGVVNLRKCCYSCYLRFVFSGIFENKASFSIILLVGLFSPYTHKTIFVTVSRLYFTVLYGLK